MLTARTLATSLLAAAPRALILAGLMALPLMAAGLTHLDKDQRNLSTPPAGAFGNTISTGYTR